MSRLKLIEELVKVEKNLERLRELSNDVNNAYSKSISAEFRVGGTMFHPKYKGEEVLLNKELLSDFLAEEIVVTMDKIRSLISSISGYE